MAVRCSLRALLGCLGLACVLVAAGCSMTTGQRQHEWEHYTAEVEAGGLWQSRNDIGVPGDSGTRFSMAQLMGRGPSSYARVGLGYRINPIHEVRLLWAPLSMSGSGELDQTTQFAGQSFAAGVPTSARYRLDSYQLTWRAKVHEGEVWRWHAGLSGRYLDGGAELEQAGVVARFSEDGFLPMLHLDGGAQLFPGWRAELNADAGALDQRRMFDISAQVKTALDDDWELGFGYRGTEAWFENDEAFNFPWFHAALISLGYRL